MRLLLIPKDLNFIKMFKYGVYVKANNANSLNTISRAIRNSGTFLTYSCVLEETLVYWN